MTIVPSLPFGTLVAPAVPGLIRNYSGLDDVLNRFDQLMPQQRYQVLDTVASTLRAAGNREALAERIDRQIMLWQQGGKEVDDTNLITDIRESMRRDPPPASDSQTQEVLWQRHRLITRSIGSQHHSSILIRGPEHLIGLYGHLPLVDEFGKVVAELWRLNPVEAKSLLCRWTPFDRTTRADGELHYFTRSLKRASLFASRIASNGLDVRYAPIPAALVPESGTVAEPVRAVYWVTGCASTFPVSRWIQDFVPPNPTRSVKHLDLAGERDLPLDSPDANRLLFDLFRRPISLDEVLNDFEIDVPGYAVDTLRLDRYDETGVSIHWDIATDSGESAGQLRGWIPDIPPPGTPWIAWGDSLNAEIHETSGATTLAQHVQRGLGRRSMQRILTFLWRLGLNGMDMEARWEGIAFMAHIGFDFVTRKVREATKAAFRDYLKEKNIPLSPRKTMDIDAIQHAWNLYDFQNESGDPIGKQFLVHFGRVNRETLPFRFPFQSNYPGWRRLFSKQIQHQAPDERLERLRSEEGAAERRADVQAQFRELTGRTLHMNPSIPVELRRSIAALVDIALFFEDTALAAHHDARLDPLTGLLNRRGLTGHNRELEKGMAAHPDKDDPNAHWVLMLDIDHFKPINDTHGHLAGDEVIRKIARRLEETGREGDLIARYGGEEFCIVLRHSGRHGAEVAAERLRRQIAERPFVLANGKQIDVSVSIGAAPFQVMATASESRRIEEANPFEERGERTTSMDFAIHDADIALYRAKEAGRNRVRFGGEPISE